MPSGSVCSSEAPFCQYSVEVLVSISLGSEPSPRNSEPVLPVSGSESVAVENGNSFSGKPWSSCWVPVRAGWPNGVLKKMRPTPAMCEWMPSKTLRPCSSRLKPSEMWLRR